jgi:adenosylhomocysteinase
VNLAAAEGHPASVMDMSFATQALACEWIAKEKQAALVYDVPVAIEDEVANLKLASMGVKVDKLTKDQKDYLQGWQHGT